MEQTARILFEKFLDGTCTKEELDRLMEILQQNNHEAAFRSMLEKVYQDIDRPLTSDTFASTDPMNLPGEKPGSLNRLESHSRHPKTRGRLKYIVGAAAACLLLAIGLGYVWKAEFDPGGSLTRLQTAFNHQGQTLPEGPYKKQKTSRAEQKYLLLPDGTQVWLNAESSLIVPDQFEKHKRVVYLKGEAFFDVKHAEKIPFIIHMPDNVTTTVLGTAFDIKAYGDKKFSVTVKRGKVQVSKDKKAIATLTVGQQVKMVKNQDIQPIIQEVKKENIASWTEGKLSYDASELKDILADLERVYNVHIELRKNQLSGEIITTTFNKEDGIKAVLETLCMLTGTKFQKDRQTYIIE